MSTEARRVRDAARNRRNRRNRREAIRGICGERCEECRAPAWSMTRREPVPAERDRRTGTYGPADIGLTGRPDALLACLVGRVPLCRSCHSRRVNSRRMASRPEQNHPQHSPEFREEILRSA